MRCVIPPFRSGGGYPYVHAGDGPLPCGKGVPAFNHLAGVLPEQRRCRGRLLEVLARSWSSRGHG